MKIKVYSGLSISNEQLQIKIPGALFSNPIKRNDLQNDIKSGINIVVIIDGVFDQQLAVSAGEIVDALRSGLKVYGCSSMGAMRAVECENHGMIGCGKIYNYIKNNSYFRDDYLAQVFYNDESFELNYDNLTWIDLYFKCNFSIESNLISNEFAEFLLKAYANLFYTERSISKLSQYLILNRMMSENEVSFLKNLPAAPQQKFLDALETLEKVNNDLFRAQSTNNIINAAAEESLSPKSYYPDKLIDRTFFKGE